MNRRPTCEEATPREAGGDSLVQIGLPTGTRSTGFEATRRDFLTLMGFVGRSVSAAAARRSSTRCRCRLRRRTWCPAFRTSTRPPAAAAASGAAWCQAARRPPDQDRRQRSLAAVGRRDLRGGPGHRAVAVRRRAAARPAVDGGPGPGPRSTTNPTGPGRTRRSRLAPRRAADSDDHQPVDPLAPRELRAVFPSSATSPTTRSRRRAARGQPALLRRGRGAALRFDRARVSSRWRPTSSGPGCRRWSSRASGPATRAVGPARPRLPRPVRARPLGHRQQRRPADRRRAVGARAVPWRSWRRSDVGSAPAPGPSRGWAGGAA